MYIEYLLYFSILNQSASVHPPSLVTIAAVSYTHLRAHETAANLV